MVPSAEVEDRVRDVDNRVLHKNSPVLVYIIHLIRTNELRQQKGASASGAGLYRYCRISS